LFQFFFSSRRRHTRFSRDWSSDVCSSDLTGNGLMAGKRGLILGVANNRSIAWGIAKALVSQGAEIALTYQGEALKKRVEPLAARSEERRVGKECTSRWST